MLRSQISFALQSTRGDGSDPEDQYLGAAHDMARLTAHWIGVLGVDLKQLDPKAVRNFLFDEAYTAL